MPIGETELYRSPDLVVRARTGAASPVCVVTFQSHASRLTLDREGFGEGFFLSRGVNAIHVIPRDNDWYLLPDVEIALGRAAEAARAYERVSSYGSSMGAYAAIRLGGLAGASTAIALSPQFSIDPRVVPFENRWPEARRLDYAIERRLASRGFVASAFVFYDPSDRDGRHVALYRPLLKMREIRLFDCGHPVTGFLAQAQLLEGAVLGAAQGDFDPEAFERDALAARDRTPQYYLTLAARPAPPEQTLTLVRRAYELIPEDVGYIGRYGRALWMAGRHEEAAAQFDQAMRKEPDHSLVMRYVCEYLDASGRRTAARAAAEWLLRLHPGAAPIEQLHEQLSRLSLADAPGALRAARARLAARRTGASAPRQPLSPPLSRLEASSGGENLAAASPPRVRSWVRHAAIMAEVAGVRADIALIGDSRAERWPARGWPGRVLNFGSSGDRAEHLLWRLACLDDGALAARAAVVTIGIDNLLAGDRLEPTVETVARAVREVRRAAPAATIAVVGLPPFGSDFRFRDDDRVAFNAALLALPDAIFVEEPALWTPFGADAACYEADRIHVSPAGYERLTAAARRTLAARS